ncbi:hypothetical protein MX572_25275 (plasmid) [Rhodococcus pyridinivorans]|uniref:hypothetical protein n=1 Tax=Rhodococcus TaxID=1827 RepID=UPI0018DDBCB7|nr:MULTISPECIES: hypothetical protein [Rhodococcus]UTM40220.1 hypothetical protein MX572_25275 [Rhodococcus pyridinivorans]
MLTDVEVRHILQRHHADNAKGKALMLFTTAAPQVRKRAFSYTAIYLIGPGGIVTPWNRRARILAPSPRSSRHGGGCCGGRSSRWLQ